MCKEDGEFRPLDSHCLADVGYSTPICPIDCLSTPTPPPPSQWAAFKVSASPSPRPIWAGAAVLRYNYPSAEGNLPLTWPSADGAGPGSGSVKVVYEKGGVGIGTGGWLRWGREGGIAGLLERWEDTRIDKRVDVVWENDKTKVWKLHGGVRGWEEE